MLNRRFASQKLTMTPEGSLNKLEVSCNQLCPSDPLFMQGAVCCKQLVSRHALQLLLISFCHPCGKNIRSFLTDFDLNSKADAKVFNIYAQRFIVAIRAARQAEQWTLGSNQSQQLAEHWRSIQTLVISGGLTSKQFGIELATQIERECDDLSVIASPWGGNTALYGLAQTVRIFDSLLVLDFGATGIKRGVATNYGNRLRLLPELKVSRHKQSGLIGENQFRELLRQTRDVVGQSMPVAISLACYLKDNHPFDYSSGIYHTLGDHCDNLGDALQREWLPKAGFFGLSLLEHDSTAAALAFRFRQPAMMVTLGTGLGSAPCPNY